MDLKWKTELRLTYRKFGRMMEDSELAFDHVKTKIRELEPVRAVFGEVEEDYWPVRPEAIKHFQSRGVFLMNADTRPTAVIRELPITLVCDSYEDAQERLDRILRECPFKFAVISVVREYLTEHLAD